MVDHQIRAIEQAAEVVRLHVDRRHPVVRLERGRRDMLDLDVEHVRHPEVLRPCHSLHGADDRGRFGPPQQVAKREPARQGIRVRIVVQEDQDAIGVGEIPLVLLHARASHRAAQLGDQGRPEQLGQLEVGHLAVVILAILRPGRWPAACLYGRRRRACRRRHGLPRGSS